MLTPEAVPSTPNPLSLWVPADIQRLWFATQSRAWSTLILVPAHRDGSAVRVAQGLANAGSQTRTTPVRFISAMNLELQRAPALIEEMLKRSPVFSSTVVAGASPLSCPATIPLAQAADGVILCVELGHGDVDSAKQTVECIGADRFWGTVVVSPKAVP